jgi:hypothetical protein
MSRAALTTACSVCRLPITGPHRSMISLAIRPGYGQG